MQKTKSTFASLLTLAQRSVSDRACARATVRAAERESGLHFHQTVQITLDLVKDMFDALKDEMRFADEQYRVDANKYFIRAAAAAVLLIADNAPGCLMCTRAPRRNFFNVS